MNSWYFEREDGTLKVIIDSEERGAVQLLQIGKKLTTIKVMLTNQEELSLSVNLFDDAGSEICRSMTPLKKSKVEPFCVSRTKFVERWNKFVTEPPSLLERSLSSSSSGLESDDDRSSITICGNDEKKSERSSVSCPSDDEKTGRRTVTGIHDKILRENFIGTFDVHINNLVPPHVSRATRILHFDHVTSLSDSFKEQDCGQFVILIGMLTSPNTPTDLKVEGTATIEVLGGNHTRQALQSLLQKGAVSKPHVKVNLYKTLPTTSALAIGYQHNTVLHERRRPLSFMDKVRLMRQCRPAVPMTKVQVIEWKDMLVTIFRVKDRRRLMTGFQQHMAMARMSDAIWTKAVCATEKMNVSEKFFRPLMRIDNDSMIEQCLDTLINNSEKEFHKQVKSFVDQGCVKKKNNKQSKVLSSEEEFTTRTEDNFRQKYLCLKDEHENLKKELAILKEENNSLKGELQRCRESESKGIKRVHESDDMRAVEFHKGEKVQALWKDENGEEWLTAKVIKLNKNGIKVQYEVDNGVANIPSRL